MGPRTPISREDGGHDAEMGGALVVSIAPSDPVGVTEEEAQRLRRYAEWIPIPGPRLVCRTEFSGSEKLL